MRRNAVLLALVCPGVAQAAITAAITGGDVVDEGRALQLSASATSSDPACEPLTYAWDLDGDGAFDDGTSQTAQYTAPDGPGSATVALQVTPLGTPCADGPEIDTHEITIANLAPTAVIASGPAVLSEGALGAYSVLFDDVPDDSHTIGWDWGDGSNDSTADHAWSDEGVYTVTVTVTDDDGASASDTHSVTVSNVAPTISSAQWDAEGSEGTPVAFVATASDPGADTLTYVWDFGDGSPDAVGPEVEHTYADNGLYNITLTVSDGDLGVDTQMGNVAIRNEAPELLTLEGPASGSEGALLEWAVTFEDPGAGDTHRVTWTWGDGSPSVRGLSADHVYGDEGLYTLDVRVCDDELSCDSMVLEVDISNVAPEITSLAGPTQTGEGTAESFSCAATDVGADKLAFTLDFGDGTVVEAELAEHAFPDDGEYTVTCTVSDLDGGQDTQQQQVVVDNLAPVIAGVPSDFVAAGAVFTFDPDIQEVPADELVWELTGPAGLEIDDEQLVWSTSAADVGVHPVTLTVTDDDGASDTLEFVLTVEVLDDDGDGMDDLWELAHGLDPTDPGDAATDLDGDGRSNLQEAQDGSDPERYDGPSAPVALAPLDGEEVSSAPVELVVDDALSPTLETLLYDFEVYDEPDLSESSLVALADDLGSTTFLLDSALDENTWYFWRAAAQDPYTAGDWSEPSSFFFNTVNDAPGAPGLRSPQGGVTVADLTPTLELDEAQDLDEDALTYTFELEGASGALLDSVDDVEGDGAIARWTPDVVLADDTTLCWTAHAVDEHGEIGPEPAAACFTVDTSNETPLPPTITDPVDQAHVASLTPEITVTNGVDPEGRATSHLFELDTAPTFDSPSLQTQSVASELDGSTTWQVGLPLGEDTWYHLRVLTTDGAANSEWAQVSFFASATNSPPSTPALDNPADGAAFAEGDLLSVINAADPEQQLVTYEFAIYDSAGAPAQQIADVAEDSAGVTAWAPGPLPPGTYTWSSRATDEGGAASEWATARSLQVLGAEEPPQDTATDTGLSKDSTGCACDSGASPTSSLFALLALITGSARSRRAAPCARSRRP